MKRICVLLLISALFLCACSAPTYETILQKWDKQDRFYLTLTHKKEVVFADEGQEPMTAELSAKLQMKKDDGRALYQYIETDSAPVYFADGYEYRELMDVKYRNPISEEDFLQDLSFVKPLPAEQALTEKIEEAQLAVTLENDWALALMKDCNPDFADTITDGSLHYTAKIEKKRIKSYTYEFTLHGQDEEMGDYTITDIYTVRAEPTVPSFSLPNDLSSYAEMNLKEYEDQSEEEWQRQILFVMLEALYNPDGSKAENFDQYYEEFKEMYGEEYMKLVTEAADMFRGQ
ncbi:MAG: hypothetical protein HFE78_00510 [Clostridiales bacterium]|nr:hypothetical protein [Clostridiales bacterium]